MISKRVLKRFIFSHNNLNEFNVNRQSYTEYYKTSCRSKFNVIIKYFIMFKLKLVKEDDIYFLIGKSKQSF